MPVPEGAAPSAACPAQPCIAGIADSWSKWAYALVSWVLKAIVLVADCWGWCGCCGEASAMSLAIASPVQPRRSSRVSMRTKSRARMGK